MKIYGLLFFCCVYLLVGCTSTLTTPRPNDPDFSPVYPDEDVDQIASNGSIFSRISTSGLYSDTKAHRVGDMITVNLIESTSSSKNESTKQEKDTDMSLNAMTILGQPVTSKDIPVTNTVVQANSFEGKSSGSQSNSLQGSITVTVVRVMGNGTLMVRGEKWLMLGNGSEFIRLTGLIRPADISADNMVESTRIADARIYYGGTGDFANTQKQGILGRFFNGPFWVF